MILKMFSEITNAYVLVDKVDSVKVDRSNWAIHADTDVLVDGEPKMYPVMSGYMYIAQKNEIESSIEHPRFIPIREASDDVKNCTDFVLAKNLSVLGACDECLVAYHNRYTRDIYTAKLIYATIGDTVKVFMLGFNQAVYVLNDFGKTIEVM